MAEEALARQKKAQRVLAEAYAQADVAATVEDRARLRANARLEAELLTEVCDYVQADMALKDCRFSAPWKIFIPSACKSEMAALALCRKTRAEYVRNTKKCDVKEYVSKLFDAEVAAEAERTKTTPTELALKDDALRSSGR